MAERTFGALQFATDVATSDLHKGRLLGFAPYVKYREFCDKKPYKSFNNLRHVMSAERIHRLQEVYKNVEDIDLMAGLWTEEHVPGGRIPHTLHCLITTQLQRTIVSDRHWYERSNRPHAFSKEQLKAIRKITVAGVMCANANGIKKIQPRAFYSIDKKLNPLMDCSSPEIGNLDLSPWQDKTCIKDKN